MIFEGVKIYHCRTRQNLSRGFKFWIKSPIPGQSDDSDEVKASKYGRTFRSLKEAGRYILANQEFERAEGVRW